MTPRFAFVALVSTLLLGPLNLRGQDQPAAAAKPPADAGLDQADDVQAILFLGEARPVFIRLRIHVDGEPFRAYHRKVWDESVRTLFAQVDRNGDGKLSADEAARLPQPRVTAPMPANAPQPIPVNIAFNFRALDANGDGSVSPEELGDHQRRYGGSVFQLSFAPDPMPGGTPVSEAILNRFDQNGDGKVAKDELVTGADKLFELDQDGDEMLTPQEITRRAVNPEATRRARRPSETSEGSPFVLLGPGDTGAALAQRLLARYGTADVDKGMKLSRAAIGLPQALFTTLDKDNDELLDATELANFTSRPADLELALRLGSRKPDELAMEVIKADGQVEPLSPSVTKASDGVLVLPLDKLHLEFQANEGRPEASATARQAIVQQFMDADKDQKGELDKKTVVQRNFFPRQFDLLDRDGDGKLTLQELTDYLDKVQSVQAKAFTSSTVLLLSGEGQGLFEALDRNRDGKLSRREVRALPQLMPADGQLALEQLPRTRRLALGLYRASFNRVAGGEPVTLPGVPLLTLDWSGDNLAWFRKMDRNGDDDLSRREFLGPREDFDRLDIDGDGLLSIEEAAQAKPAAAKP